MIDTHTHVWGPDTEDYPWQAPILPPAWDGPYTYDSLLADMDRVGVEHAVLVTTPLYGRGPDANAYANAAIDAHPDRFSAVALVEYFPAEPESARESVQRAVTRSGTIGIRMHAALAYANTPSEVDRFGAWITDDRLTPVWEEAAAQETTVFVFPKAQQLGMVEQLARRHPDVEIVVDHMAWPDETTRADEPPWTRFEQLAEYDNVGVKLSSLPRSSVEPWPYPDLFGYVRRLVDWFGPERCMLGSDYPWMRSWATYEECLSWVETVPNLSERDQEYLTHRTFERRYR